jgi:hypothetical protein
MSNMSFKTFLEAIFKRDEKGRMARVHSDGLSSYSNEMFIEAAYTIIHGGFKNNFKDGLDNGWLYRGSEKYETYFETDAFSMCFVDRERPDDRVSIFSGNQLTSNFWHVIGAPSRRRCVMTTPDSTMASNFGSSGKSSIVLPRDNTICYKTDRDWNESFEDIIRSKFPGGNRVGIGRLASVFYWIYDRFSRYKEIDLTGEFKEFSKKFKKVNGEVNNSLQDFKDMFSSLEEVFMIKYPNSDRYVLVNTPGNGVHNMNMSPEIRNIIVDMMERVREGEDLFGIFKNMFDDMKDEVVSSKTPSELINTKSSHSPEIWWTGSSLVFNGKYTGTNSRKKEILDKLWDYVEKIENGDLVDDGEPD